MPRRGEGQRILLTGATGLIGRHLPPRLVERGFQVHAVSSRPRPGDAGDVSWHTVDLLAPDAVDPLLAEVQPSHLIHLAWHAGAHERWTTVENVRWLEASLALLRAFARHGGRRAVMGGTCAEYDWRFGLCSEAVTPLEPATLYGRTKLALGEVAMAAGEALGVSLAWARVFFVYGPGEDSTRLVASVARALLGGEQARTSAGTQVRDYLHASDVADALAALLASEACGAVNVGSGEATTLREIVEAIGRLVGRPELIRLGALASSPDEAPFVVADVRRLRGEVGWQPRRGLDAGLADTVAWWREQAAEGEDGRVRRPSQVGVVP